MSNKVGSLHVELTASIATYKAKLAEARDDMARTVKEFRSSASYMQRLGGELRNVGQSLTAAVTLPLAGGVAAAAKAAISFESAFAGVRKTVTATDAEFQKIAQSFRAMSQQMPVSAEELARIGEAAGQLGIRKEDLGAFTETMAKLGATTNLSSDEAATTLARFDNVVQNGKGNFDRLGSTLVALGNNFAGTEQDIASMAQRLAAAGNAVNMSQAEILSVATALSSVGIKAEAGGSAISRTLIDMASAVSNGGAQLERLATVSGMTSEQFSKAFKDNAASALEAFIAGLARTKESGGNLIGVIESLGITEIQERNAVMSLAGARNILTQAFAAGKQAWADNTALSKEFAERAKTTESQLKMLWERIRDVGRTLGDALMPALHAAIDAFNNQVLPALQGMAQAFATLPDSMKLVAIGFVGLAAAAGPALWAFGSVSAGAAAMAKTLSTIGAASLVAPHLAALKAALAGVTGALVLKTAAVGAVAVATTEGTKSLITYGDSLMGISKEESTAGQHVGLLRGAVILLGDAMSGIANTVFKAFTTAFPIKGDWAGVVDLLRTAFDNLAISVAAVSGLFFKLGQGFYGTGVTAEHEAAKARDLAEASRIAGRAVTDWGTAQRILADHLKKSRDEAARVKAEQAALAKGTKDSATSSQAAAAAAATLAAKHKLLAEASKIAGKEITDTDKAEEILAKAREERQARMDKLTGDDIRAQARQLAADWHALSEAQRGNPATVDRLVEAYGNLREQLGGPSGLPADLEALWQAAQKVESASELDVWLERVEERAKRASAGVAQLAQVAEDMRRAEEASSTRDRSGDAQAEEQLLKRLVALGRSRKETDTQIAQRLERQGFETGKINAALKTTVKESATWSQILQNISNQFSAMGGRIAGLFSKLSAGVASIGAQFGKEGPLSGIFGKGGLSNLFESGGKFSLGTAAKSFSGALAAGMAAFDIGKTLVSIFRKSEADKVAADVGRDLGVKLSSELNKTIAEESKRLGDRNAAILKHLKAVIDEAGGVAAFGFDKAVSKARDLFSQIETGKLSVQEAGKAFSDVFGDLATHLEKTGGLASEQFLELMRLDARFGTQSQAVKDYLGRRVDALQSNLDTILKTGISTQAGATAIGGALAAAYKKALEGGASGFDALKDLQPQIDAFEAQLAELGLEGGAAFDQIRSMAALAGDEIAGPQLEKIRAAAGGLTELHNMGLLTEEGFRGLTAEAGAAYEKLRETGQAGPDALRLLQPDLQRIWELQKKTGYQVDENTQALLREAEAAGLVGEAHMSAEERTASAMERVSEILERIAEKWGVVIDKTKEFGQALSDAASLGPGTGAAGAPAAAYAGAQEAGGSFAFGGADDFGDESSVLVHGREGILPADHDSSIARDIAGQLAAHILPALRGGGGGDVFMDGEKVGRVLYRRSRNGGFRVHIDGIAVAR